MTKFFFARLRGANEVPPVQTNAFGTAKFVANKSRCRLKFFLTVNNIRNLVQAHIHFGERGENGPVIAFLFGADLETLEEQNGVSTLGGVVTGTITDDDIVPNDVGIKTVEDLIKLWNKGKRMSMLIPHKIPQVRLEVKLIHLNSHSLSLRNKGTVPCFRSKEPSPLFVYLFRILIRLMNAKHITFRVHIITLPRHSR